MRHAGPLFKTTLLELVASARVAKQAAVKRKRNMADDKSQRGGADRRTVAGGEDYEVDYFARKHGLPVEQAQKLISRFGNDRATLDAEAEKLTKE